MGEIEPLELDEARYARRAVANRTEAREQNPGQLGASEERVFVRDGLRSYRKTYNVREVYWGAGIAAVLLGVLGWVRYKGLHPDPSLNDMSAALSAGPAPSVRSPAERKSSAPSLNLDRGPAAHAEPGADPSAPSAAGSERGPLPSNLGADQFREGKIGAYTPENLYVKINGRAEFYEAFGVQSMHALTLEASSGASIDIELFDLGAARNALGTYNGERPPGMDSTLENGSSFRFDRNAAYLARGRYYVRFVGSDESQPVVAEVKRLMERFREALPGEELPWAFSLFVDQWKLQPSQVSYARENAFSFGFARDVYKAALSPADSQENLEAFVAVKSDAAGAKQAALDYQQGFQGLGAPAGKLESGVPLFKDEFLGSFSTASSSERWVFGVRGAPSAERANEVLERLKRGLHALPAEVLARAVPSPDEPEAESSAGPGQAATLEGENQ